MKTKIKAEIKKVILNPTRSTIMQYAGKLHGKYDKKKINIDKVRDLIDYSDL